MPKYTILAETHNTNCSCEEVVDFLDEYLPIHTAGDSITTLKNVFNENNNLAKVTSFIVTNAKIKKLQLRTVDCGGEQMMLAIVLRIDCAA